MAVDFVHDKVADIALDRADYAVQSEAIVVDNVDNVLVEVGFPQNISNISENQTRK